MSKIVIIHPDIYNSEKDKPLLESFTSDVVPIKYDDEMTKNDLFNEINRISNTNNVKQIAFIYHYPGYYRLPFFYDNIKEKSKYIYWTNSTIDIIRELKEGRAEELKSNEFVVDILSCDLNNSKYKEEIQKIEAELQINIRYSIDKTGNNENGGNWILESDNMNIKDEYFTDKVLEWNGVLDNIDLAPAIKTGTYNNFITWNDSTKTYTIVKDFLWTELGVSNTDYIVLKNSEIFDGNGKTINLVGIANWVGLFGSSATDSTNIPIIKNLGVLNGALSRNETGFICRGSDRESKSFIKINNCYTTGNITRNRCGGIIGVNAGSNGYCEINNCYTTGNLTKKNLLLFYCDSSGGITGASAGSNNGRCIINNCYTTGNLTENAINCGGIVGSTPATDNGYCEINNCYTIGNIIGISSGGIIGYIDMYSYNPRGTIIVSNCYSLGINNEYSGGILGELGNILSDTINVNNCVYNGGNISATENNLININNCTNNLSVLNNSIYNWNSSIWASGNEISITINGTSTLYKLPILQSFQKIPWINKSSSLDYYIKANNLAKYNDKIYSLFIGRLTQLGLTSERIDNIVTIIDNIPSTITKDTIITDIGLNGIEHEIDNNTLRFVRELILDVIFNNSVLEFISTPNALKLSGITKTHIRVINNNYLIYNANMLNLSRDVSLNMPLYFYNPPSAGTIQIIINETLSINILINEDKTKYTYNNIEYSIGQTINVDKYTIIFGSITILENPVPDQPDQPDQLNQNQLNISVPPCCIVNVYTKNPQMTNYDNTNISNNSSGRAIANNVTQIQNTGRYRRNGMQPIFKSYQQYMMYLQSKHH